MKNPELSPKHEPFGLSGATAAPRISRSGGRAAWSADLILRWWPWAIALGDAVLINLRMAYWLRYDREWLRAVDEANFVSYGRYLSWALLLTAMILFSLKMAGAYQLPTGLSWLDSLYPTISSTAAGIGAIIVIFFFYPSYIYSRLMFAYAAVLIVVFLSTSRLLESMFWRRLQRQGVGIRRVLIVGLGEVGRTIIRHIVARPELGFEVVGFVDDDPEKMVTDMGRFKALGSTDVLPGLVHDLEVDEVIITLPWVCHRKIMSILSHCQREQVRCLIVPDIFQLSLSRIHMEDLQGIPLMGIREPSLRGWNLVIKRAIDVTVSSIGLILLSPLCLLIALAINLESSGGTLFRQQRVGRHGALFVVYKFRSMYEGAEVERDQLDPLNEADGPLFKIRDDPRRTRTGRVLRRFSLDEIPQLYNVLRGEMSLVGPRPGLPEEVARYEDWHRKRLEVSPGITGLWQTAGRSEVSFEEMCLLDIYYAEQWTLSLDFRIMLKTIPAIILGRGAY